MNKKLYTVVADGRTLKCIDTDSGVPVNAHRLDDDIVSGPVVTGDRVTVVINKAGTRQGLVFVIPSLYVVATFRG